MSKKLDLIGQRYGRLVVQAYAGVIRGGTAWVCLCDCGTTVTQRANSLRTGNTRSCGCISLEHAQTLHRTHAQSHTRTYRIWKAMWTRCTNPRQVAAQHYVLRGVRVCARWRDFAKFLEDMGHAPPRASIDRKDNDGDYTPENCRWATYQQQARNTRGKHGKQRGVHWVPRLNKWRVVVCVGLSRHHLGVFRNYADALLARKAGEKRYWKNR